MSITYDGAVAGLGRPARVRPAQVRLAHVRSTKAPVRLTRRGRVVVVLMLLVLLVVGFSLGMAGQAAGPHTPGVARTVTVHPGESLWQVATRVAPDADPRLVVDQLVRINHLTGATVVTGQQLVVPGTR